jgi:hypothetical protein
MMNLKKNKMDKIARKLGREKLKAYSDYEPREIKVDERVEMQDAEQREMQGDIPNDDVEMEVQTEKVEPTIDSPIPPMMDSGLDSLPDNDDTVEHIIEIDNNTFQIRINLPRRADIKIFKEKIEKIHKLLSSNELLRIFGRDERFGGWGK